MKNSEPGTGRNITLGELMKDLPADTKIIYFNPEEEIHDKQNNGISIMDLLSKALGE